MNRASWPPPLRRAAQVPRLIGKLARWGRPARALLFGPLSIGDDLLCTAVLREARKRGTPFAMITNRPELFAHNPDPTELIPFDAYHVEALRRLGTKVVHPYYATADPTDVDRDVFGAEHIIAAMCRAASLEGEVALRPYFLLTSAERAAGQRGPRQVAFQSSVAQAAMPFGNKEWVAARFAEVVMRLPGECTTVQLGVPADPALPVGIDLRGRTTLREAAAVLAGSELFIGLEGFLGHLARAVECPAVIILGGRARVQTVGYPGNEYLAAPVPCSPCGWRNRCVLDRQCLRGVTVDHVLEAARRLLNRPVRALPVPTCIL